MATKKIIVEAVYEEGVLKPLQPLNLPEGTKVRIEIEDKVQALRELFKRIDEKAVKISRIPTREEIHDRY